MNIGPGRVIPIVHSILFGTFSRFHLRLGNAIRAYSMLTLAHIPHKACTCFCNPPGITLALVDLFSTTFPHSFPFRFPCPWTFFSCSPHVILAQYFVLQYRAWSSQFLEWSVLSVPATQQDYSFLLFQATALALIQHLKSCDPVRWSMHKMQRKICTLRWQDLNVCPFLVN